MKYILYYEKETNKLCYIAKIIQYDKLCTTPFKRLDNNNCWYEYKSELHTVDDYEEAYNKGGTYRCKIVEDLTDDLKVELL